MSGSLTGVASPGLTKIQLRQIRLQRMPFLRRRLLQLDRPRFVLRVWPARGPRPPTTSPAWSGVLGLRPMPAALPTCILRAGVQANDDVPTGRRVELVVLFLGTGALAMVGAGRLLRPGRGSSPAEGSLGGT